MFKNCVIHLLIFSRICASPPNRDEDNKEIAGLLEKFENFINTDDKDTKILRKAEFLGALMYMGRKAARVDVLLTEQFVLKARLDDMQNRALKLFVIPYFCQKFGLYGLNWDPKYEKIEDLDLDDSTGTSLYKRDLNEQNRVQAKKWNRILTNNTHPSAIQFKTSLEKKYPGVPLSTLAKDLGQAIVLLNNLKHGSIMAFEPKLSELLQVDSAIKALSNWSGLSDPIILGIIYEFEKVTTSREWKPT